MVPSSFWMAGFEGADHVNAVGHRHDPQLATGHLQRADDDYRRLARLGIRTVRESLGWRLTEGAAGFDFSRMRHLQSAAQRNGVQIVWTLWHYGVPPDVDYFDDRLIERFCAYAVRAGQQFRRLTDEVPVWNPINEINFLSWAATASTHLWPHRGGRDAEGYELKRRLVRAMLRATALLRDVDPRARFMQVEPIVHVAAPADRPELAEQAARERDWQWQACDLISGRTEPELGGSAAALDLLGLSHYDSSQWETGTLEGLHWHTRDVRRLPLSQLLAEAHSRYGRPVVVAETGHLGAGRAQWLDEMAAETLRARRRGVPVIGFCLYPAVGRPDWERAEEWHVSGLWDTPCGADGERGRVLNLPCALRLRRWQRRLPHFIESRNRMHTLIVFSHLRWNFVYQRPQHLMTRLACHHRVLFVEEPLRGNATPYLERYAPAHNVEVLRPRTTVDAPGFDDAQFPELRALLADYLADFGISDYDAWFYTPMALPMLQGLQPRAVVYDCMDELSAFRFAPPLMLQREAELLERADVVFAGGPSLYDAKRRRHGNVHLLPSAVDAAHFAPSATREADPDAERLLRDVPRPRLGFFGVIDERFDADLLGALAAARPWWQFVMVGPVVKVSAESLPRRDNIHWFGQQPYERLAHFAAAWDVCLLPFALNDATRFISPTKTLEYMAAERPIVSTPVRDVARLYGDAVALAEGPAQFLAACEQALAMPPAAWARRVALMRSHVERTSWNNAARTVLAELQRLDGREQAATPTARPRPQPGVAERALEALASGGPAPQTSGAGT